MKIIINNAKPPFLLQVLAEAGAKFTISESREIEILLQDKATKIIIPHGFKTDMATIPQWLWIFFPPIGTKEEQYAMASILHDFLYNTKPFPRRVCDYIFLEAMKQYGVGRFVRSLFFICVTIKGRKHFKK
jgi:hypothetical protein